MGTSGNRDCQWASRSVLKDFTGNALAISVGNLFHNGTARIVKSNGRQHELCFLDQTHVDAFAHQPTS